MHCKLYTCLSQIKEIKIRKRSPKLILGLAFNPMDATCLLSARDGRLRLQTETTAAATWDRPPAEKQGTCGARLP